MDKTYAESQGQSPFDWNKVLANPPQRDSKEHEVLRRLAARWVTCACGNQCAIIPRESLYGTPIDQGLVSLGLNFSYMVARGEWNEARDILKRIETRASQLISRELSKLNEDVRLAQQTCQ